MGSKCCLSRADSEDDAFTGISMSSSIAAHGDTSSSIILNACVSIVGITTTLLPATACLAL